MTPIAIYADSRRPGQCRSCGAPIEWAETVATGKAMPFDPPIVALRQQSSMLESGRAVEWVDGGTTHFATCPDGAAWRRRGRAGSGPRRG